MTTPSEGNNRLNPAVSFNIELAKTSATIAMNKKPNALMFDRPFSSFAIIDQKQFQLLA